MGFTYPKSSQDGMNARAAEPNTYIGCLLAHSDRNERLFYLQTNESNIVEYRYGDDNFPVYTTKVIYA